ncbi:MAG: hypothetical protein IKP66_06960 [Lachnospiraceae bacterium]|nr:hypothetical protein [Lachnospiraceae bacterium]
MRLCRFEKQKRYILNWDEDGMEKGEYICYDTDDTTAKLAFKSNLKKQYEIKHSEMNLAKKLGGDLLPKYYYKWTPEFVISPYTFKAFLKTIENFNK